MTSPAYLDTKQASARFGLSRSWLEKLRVYGGGPRFRKVGRRVIYSIADFEAWLDDRTRDSTSAA